MPGRDSKALLSILIGSLAAAAIASADDRVVHDRSSGRTIVVRPDSTKLSLSFGKRTPAEVADSAVSQNAHLFGVKDSSRNLNLQSVDTDALGKTHYRYQQSYKGVPVFGGQLSAHLDKNGSISHLDGELLPESELDVLPRISAATATQSALTDWRRRFGAEGTVIGSAHLEIFDRTIIDRNLTSLPRLTWEVEMYQDFPSKQHERIFVDAISGEVVQTFTLRSHSLTRAVLDCAPGVPCFLDAPSGGGYVFGRSEGMPARGIHPVVGTTETDQVYDQIGLVHDYYLERFNRNGANNEGGIGDGSHVAPSITAAFMHINFVSNDCPNAFFDGFSLNFCNGVDTFDVTAHEYQHAVTQYAVRNTLGQPTGLIYQGESGALNEAYSDIFAELMEKRYSGTNDFLIGVGVNAPPLVGPIRSLQNPGIFGQPDRFNSPDFTCGTFDNGGVHINSGVLNKAAYLLLAGDTFNGCQISPISTEKVEQIFYRALTIYLTPTSSFNFAFQALNQSCSDLGYPASDCDQVRNALQAVEMDQGGLCSGATPTAPACAGSGAPAPEPQPDPGTPSASDPSNLSLRSRRIKKTPKLVTFLLGGVVTNSTQGPIEGATVNIACTHQSKSINGTFQTDASGGFAATIKLRPGRMFFCRATAGNATSQQVKVMGPKAWKKSHGRR
jgi:Zn-dependent metalloprotease